jgi:hypothetical protein
VPAVAGIVIEHDPAALAVPELVVQVAVKNHFT